MKKYLFFAAAALALTSCVSDDYTGNESDLKGEAAISFNGGTGVITRVDKTGAEAATLLGNNFVVYGWKTSTSGVQVVYDHYNVNFVTGTGTSTVTNVNGWEYVNQDRNLKGSNPVKKLGNLPATAVQEIKYWDFGATQYDFVAFSLGQGVDLDGDPATDNTYAQVISTNTPKGVDKSALASAAYQLTGKAEELAASYIADKVTVLSSEQATNKTKSVQFKFRSLGSKVRVGLYETIPGWSIQKVEFYESADDDTAGDDAVLYATGTATMPAGEGTMTVTFDSNNQAHASFAASDDDTNVANKSFGALTLNTTAEKEENNNNSTYADKYLGRTSNGATIAGASTDSGYDVVLPNEAGVEGGLNLKVKFTMISKDGSGETIVIDGATATVPKEFTMWKPNYAYTYIFKISEEVSGETGKFLYPITLDAVVVDTEDGVQETITDFNGSSITTYAKGAVNDEYYQNDNIYVKVDGKEVSASNSKLYTAVLEDGSAQYLTEAAVANCLANYTGVTASAATTETVTVGTTNVSSFYTLVGGVYYKCAAGAVAADATTYYSIDPENITGYVVKDANNKKLTVSIASGLAVATEIAVEDAPDGIAVSGNFMKFTPGAGGNFVFVYDDSTNKYLKVIKVIGSDRP